MRLAALSLLIVVLSACAGLPVPFVNTTQGGISCDVLRFEEVRTHLNVARDSTEQMVVWMRSTFGVSDHDLRIIPDGAETRWGTADSYSWPVDKTYWRALVQENRLVSFSVGWAANEPSLRDVLQCLGKPSSYVADYREAFESGGPIVLVDVFYPESGTMLTFSVGLPPETNGVVPYGEKRKLPVDAESMAIEGIDISEPVFDDEALVDLLMGDSTGLGPSWVSKSGRAWFLDMLRPWPEDLEGLEYEVVPGP